MEGLSEYLQQGWEITDDNKAEWAMKQYLKAQKEYNRIRALAAAEIEATKEWEARETASDINNMTFFALKLEAYYRKLREADPDMKQTYTLRSGKIAIRHTPVNYERVDNDALINWAVNSAEDLIMKEVRWGALKERLNQEDDYMVVGDSIVEKKTGEVIPGLKVIPRQERFYVKGESL
jgi:hypothetical protein